MKNKKLQKGSGHVLLFAIIFIAIVGALGFVGYNALQEQDANAGGTGTVGRVVKVSNGYTKCGNGYKKLTEEPLIKDAGTGWKPGPFKLIVMINRSTKNVCATLESSGAAYNVAKSMKVAVGFRNGTTNKIVREKTDKGNYKLYAGPVVTSYKGLPRNSYGVLNGIATFKGIRYSMGTTFRW